MKYLLSLFILPLFAGSTICVSGQEIKPNRPATVREYTQSFPTYPFSDPSPIPLLTNVYPYFRYDGFTTTSIEKKWKVVSLENQYLKLLILPGIGGKIWAAIEKSTGKSFFYYNHTVKFRDIAM